MEDFDAQLERGGNRDDHERLEWKFPRVNIRTVKRDQDEEEVDSDS
jgi:hypothetical protein